jgi:transposase
MEDDGRKLRVTAVHASGRRTFDPVSKARLIESCLQPGASVAQLALDHGVNANLLWKWIRQHRQDTAIAPSSTPTFIPVRIESAANQAMSRHSGAFALDLAATRGGEPQSATEKNGPLSSPTKVSASLPNGVKLTLECGDVHALAAMIGALGRVQAGR